MTASASQFAVFAIAAAACAGMVLRPFRWPEATWATAGAILISITGLLPLADVVRAIGESADVCLFLAGMMILAEVARLEGLFDWLAAFVVNLAGGSARALFALTWTVGVVVTAFLSNDATAVVLTPAVLAAARAARAPAAPFVLACAFVANAASFALPISNPANLVVFASHPPALAAWLARFALPSAAAILGGGAALAWHECDALAPRCAASIPIPQLSGGGRWALAGLGVAAAALLAVSALGRPIGAPTFVVGALTAAVVLLRDRRAPGELIRGIAWSILPLTASLFVLIAALEQTGLVGNLATWFDRAAMGPGLRALVGIGVALATNLANNLPVGLLASHALAHAHVGDQMRDTVLIGVDLGPNLAVTGSLATILWLAALRREGEAIGFWRFARLGAVVMPASLLPALAARLMIGIAAS